MAQKNIELVAGNGELKEKKTEEEMGWGIEESVWWIVLEARGSLEENMEKNGWCV